MGALEVLKLAVTHPDELRVRRCLAQHRPNSCLAQSVLNRKLWHEPKVLDDDPE